MFAIGFSIPLGAIFLDISLTKVSLAVKGADKFMHWIAGFILLFVGFYFLVKF